MKHIWQIFTQFLMLGSISFGGPAAHIGYFQRQFVDQKRWLSQDDYGRLVALCQFLPGPASSQVGFGIGYQRGGLPGACAAFLGFTLPSFLLMVGLALLASELAGNQWLEAVINGLKLLAVVIVGDAVLTMSRSFCTDPLRKTIAAISALLILWLSTPYTQWAVLAVAAIVGATLLVPEGGSQEKARAGKLKPGEWLALLLFGALLLASLTSSFSTTLAAGLFSDFYRAGAFVFGGGHVALPLIEQSVQGAVAERELITAYAAAQAVPGPMFTMASYLGASMFGGNPVLGALIATLAIFLPGFLLLLCCWRHWQQMSSGGRLAGLAAGLNAAVVGLLIAAWVNPVISSALLTGSDALIVAVGFAVLYLLRPPILVLVGGFAAAGILQMLIP